ncbi:MAG: Crp/Fnr family transcriptional regulator [Pseudomonadota bacterium]
MSDPISFDPLFHKLALRARIDAGDRAAVMALGWKRRTVTASSYVVREGRPPLRCGFILEGFAYRQKLALDGAREIVAILVPGDLIDLQNLYFTQSDHDVVALTQLLIAEVPIVELRALVAGRPAVAAAMWTDTLVEASIYREWLLNIGRRAARTRLAHLLCEFQARLHAVARSEDMEYELPMTQEQLGDTMGLTPVHVNRVLKLLEQDGLVARNKRQIKVLDWDRLRAAADFNDRYLHLDAMGA